MLQDIILIVCYVLMVAMMFLFLILVTAASPIANALGWLLLIASPFVLMFLASAERK